MRRLLMALGILAVSSATALAQAPPDTAIRVITGHGNRLRDVTISPDGQKLISASDDATIRIWGMPDGTPIRTLTGHIGPVTSVVVGQDGQTIVSGGDDFTVRVWNASNGALIRTLSGHASYVLDVALSPDGQTIVSASNDHTLKVWRLSDGALLRTLVGHTQGIWNVAITPDGESAVSVSADNTVRIWRMSDGACLNTLTGHSDAVYAVDIADDGQVFVSGGLDQTIRLWQLPGGEYVRTFVGHTNGIHGVAIAPGGQECVSGSFDRTVRVWRLSDGALLRTLVGHTGDVLSVAVSQDGQYCVSGGSYGDSTIRIWRLSNPPPATLISGVVPTSTWTAANSPYRVTGAITVPTGNTLTIEPSVDVLFDADVQFIVQGRLQAVGTATDSIRFLKGTAAEWGGIRISGGDSSTIAYARVSGGNAHGATPNDRGGGIYLSGAGTRLGVHHSVVSGNHANWGGGGVFNAVGTTLTAANSTFTSNSTGGAGENFGGGLHVSYSTARLVDCVFTANSAMYQGGIYAGDSPANVALTRCVFSGNTATYRGGGVGIAYGVLTATNCTFVNNSAPEGGGLYMFIGATATLRNCVFWDNTANQIYQYGGTTTATYSDIQNGLAGTGNIASNPLFSTHLDSAYHLTGASPCINAGDPASPLDPDGTRADMGAFAYFHEPLPIGMWTTGVPMPTARQALTAAMIDGKLYAAGGWNNTTGALNTLEIYDPATNTWTAGSPMPAARYNLAAAAIGAGAGARLFAVGGWDGGTILDALAIYDPAADTWTTGAAMPTARYGLAAATIGAGAGARLYAIGGTNDVNYLNTVEIYDPSANTWTTGAPMPAARYYPSASAIDGRIYVVGGYRENGTYVNSLEIYDPTTNTWTTSAPMPTARYALASAEIDGKLYTVGGRNEDVSVCLDIVEVYDPATDTWAIGPAMPTARYILAAGTIYGKLYAVGGRNGSSVLGTLEIFTPTFIGDTTLPRLSLPNVLTSRGATAEVIVSATVTDAHSVDLAILADADAVGSVSIVSHAFAGHANALADCHQVGDTLFVTLASSEPISLVDQPLVALAVPIKPGAPGRGIPLRWLPWPLTEVDERPAATVDGMLRFRRWGDVTGNDTISALDASWILQYVVRKRATIDAVLGDVTANGRVSGFDAALVLAKAVDSTYVFPVEGGSLPKLSAPATRTLRWFRHEHGWALMADDGRGILGGEIILRVTADGPFAVSGAPGIAFEHIGTTVRIAFARLESDNRVLLRIDGDVAAAPEVVDISLNEGAIVAHTVAPVRLSLMQNAPNPFNPETVIRYDLPATGHVRLAVYDANGRLVRTLIDGAVIAGAHGVVWNGIDDAGRNVASGVYVYRLTSAHGTIVRKMALIR